MVTTRRLTELRTQLDARMALPFGPVLVALSGGADSAALAALVVKRAPTRLAHVHHGLPASDHMEEAAQQIAGRLGLPLVVERIGLTSLDEGAARQARYRSLDGVLSTEEWLLTAHTRDDQAETVLANLVRGTGTGGLAGIPARRGRLIRPLLGVSRSETREFATLAELPWRDDPQNDDPRYLRNRIRHRLLPILESEFNPSIRSALAAAAEAFSALTDDEPAGEQSKGGWRVPNSVLWAAGPERAAAVVRASLRPFHEGYGLDRAEVTRVWEVVTGRTRATELTGGLRIARDGPWLVCTSRASSGGDSRH